MALIDRDAFVTVVNNGHANICTDYRDEIKNVFADIDRVKRLFKKIRWTRQANWRKGRAYETD